MVELAHDFGGYATKAGLKCSDGRTITSKAFEHQDGDWVPLVWQHGHGDTKNILGKARLEHRSDGTYAYAFFNETPSGKDAKLLVQHGDVVSLSIYANKLVEKSKEVLHGMIREVSLVLSGANPGAKIDFVAIQHGDDPDDLQVLDDEAVIHTGLGIDIAAGPQPVVSEDTAVVHADAADATDGEETVAQVYESMTEKQKQVAAYMVGAALEEAQAAAGPAEHGDIDTDSSTGTVDSDDPDPTAEHGETTEDSLIHQEGTTMTNVFESAATGVKLESPALTHSQLVGIVSSAQKSGSFKDALLAHAAEYGITDIELLFPDAKALTSTPEFISRRMEWVSAVLDGVKHSPFAKVKSLNADITEPEARAKGYVKGARKVEEVFKLLRRTTSPATIYKKQKLDRDDMLDITDIDVVNWLKAEMRLMIEEELARAILVGDGRSSLSPDKVKDPEGAIDGTGIRSIYMDDDLYSIKRELAANVNSKDAVKGLVRARSKYRGSGKPTLFISDGHLTDMMLEEDKFGRALYASEQELADKLRVKAIVAVDLFDEYPNLYAIMVSLQDYTIGSNKGGELTSFEDFDIDFNQHKYLQETRLSGGLTKPYSAIVVTRGEGTLAVATAPSFDGATNTITVPTVTGVIYTILDEPVTGAVVITATTEIEAEPDLGYYLASNTTTSWTYTP